MSEHGEFDTADDVEIDVPVGWLVLAPPPGISLLAIEPDESRPFRSNVVVTIQERSGSGIPATGEVDTYIETMLGEFDERLNDLDVLGVWTAEVRPDRPERLATQRLLVSHRVDLDGVDAPVEAEMMQQHVWLDEIIVTITATVAADEQQHVVDTLNVCLESLAVAP